MAEWRKEVAKTALPRFRVSVLFFQVEDCRIISNGTVCTVPLQESLSQVEECIYVMFLTQNIQTKHPTNNEGAALFSFSFLVLNRRRSAASDTVTLDYDESRAGEGRLGQRLARAAASQCDFGCRRRHWHRDCHRAEIASGRGPGPVQVVLVPGGNHRWRMMVTGTPGPAIILTGSL